MNWLLEQWHWLSGQDYLFAWIGGLSLLTVIVSFITVPMIIRRIPRQVILTLLIGLLLLNFPGKKRLEIRLIRMKPLKRAVDWIRHKAGHRPIVLPEE